MTMKFKQNDEWFTIKVNRDNGNGNYNTFTHVSDKNGMLIGHQFKDGTPNETIKEFYQSIDIRQRIKDSDESLAGLLNL